MSNEGLDRVAPGPGSRMRSALGPKPGVIISSALVMLGVVAVLGYVINSSQNSSRTAAKQRFAAGATIRSQLTSSLLATSSASVNGAAAKLTANAASLDRVVATSHLAYAVILSRDGRILASSSHAPAAALARLADRPTYLRNALSGKAWLSGLLPAASGKPLIDWAAPFTSPQGKRILVEGFPASLLGSFLRTFLDQGSSGRSIYVIDGKRGLIASSRSSGLAPGAALPAALARANDLDSSSIGKDFVASAAVAGTEWRLVLAQPESTLYPALAGSDSWLLWSVVVLVAVVGLASLMLLRRWLIGSQQLSLTAAQLELLNETLEGKVEERTALAHRRLSELQRSNSELEQFASVAAHDLQEPLRKIRMYGERLAERSELGEESRSDIVRMDAAARRQQRLIDDLLDLARVNSRGRELEPVSLEAIALDAVSDLEARVTEVGGRIEIGELPTVLGDPIQLSRVFQNLLSNALKFHRPEVPLHVRVSCDSSAPARCTILFEDNGIGFEEQYAERIFGAFQRLHGRSAYEGTGIGLSIARKIAWRHDGDITATGVPGQGATFRFTLPLAPTAAQSERLAA
jgi:signal transduction histidine kinase